MDNKSLTDQNKARMAQQFAAQQGPQLTPSMIKNAKTLVCKCGGMIFQTGFVLKKISALLSPSGQEIDVPLQVLYCKDCGKIHPESDPENILPPTIKSEKITKTK